MSIYKKSLITGLVIAVFLWGCASTPPPEPAATEDLLIRQVLELPGYSKAELFEKAKAWVGNGFSHSLDVIQYANSTEGVIIGKTRIGYVRPRKLNNPENFECRFSILVETRDNRMRVTISEMSFMGPYGRGQIYKTDMEEIRPRLEASILALKAAVEAEKKDANW